MDGQEHSLTVSEAKMEDTGRVTVTAENERGKATCSALMTVEEGAPSSTLGTEIIVLEGGTTQSSMQKTMISKKTTVMQSVQTSRTTEVRSGGSTEVHQIKSQEEMALKQVGDLPIEKFHASKKEELHQVDKEPLMIKQVTHITSKDSPMTTQIFDRTSSSFPKIESTTHKSLPPKFIRPVTSCVVKEGEEVTFEGLVEGYPVPSIKWYKNGAEIFRTDVEVTSEDGKVIFRIPRAIPKDGGQYTCTARNTAGTASSAADLIVKQHTDPPQFVQRLKAQLVKSGERVELEVEVKGVPEPEVTWYRNGQPINKTTRYRIRKQGLKHTLLILEASPDDSGKFMVKAVNTAGEAQCVADFVVEEPDKPLEIQKVTTIQQKSMVEERKQMYTKMSSTVPSTQVNIKTEKVFGEAAPVVPEATQVPEPRSLQELPRSRSPPPPPAPPPQTLTTVTTIASSLAQQTSLASSTSIIRTSKVDIQQESSSLRSTTVVVGHERSPQPPIRFPPQPLPKPKPPTEWKPVSPMPKPQRTPSPYVAKPPSSMLLPEPGPPPEFGFVTPQPEEPRAVSPRPVSPRPKSPRPRLAPLSTRARSPESPPRSRSPHVTCPKPMDGADRPMSPRPMSPRPMSPRPRSPRPVVFTRPMSPRPMSPLARPMSPLARPISPFPKLITPKPVKPLSPPLPMPGPPPEFGYMAGPPVQPSPPPPPRSPVVFRPVSPFQPRMQAPPPVRAVSPPLPEPGPKPEFYFAPPPEQQLEPGPPPQYGYLSSTTSMTSMTSTEMSHTRREMVTRTPETRMTPPFFIKVLHDTTVYERQMLVLECVVTGDPMPEVYWSLNSRKLSPIRDYKITFQSGVCRLAIDKVFPKDAGVFSCTATNPAGTATTTAIITIERMVIQPPKPSKQPQPAAPPTFEKLDRNARLVEGGNAVFELVIRGIPTPTVVWTRKNQVIRNTNKYQVKYDENTGICSLLIKNLQREDEGEYTCTATNQYGEAICTVFIQAQDVVVQQRRIEESVRVQRQQQYHKEVSMTTQRQISTTTQKQVSVEKKGYVHFDKSLDEENGEPPSPTFYTNGTDETFRVDTFEYRLLREIEFRESKTRRLTYETEDIEIIDGSTPVAAPQMVQKPRNSKTLQGSDVTFQSKIAGNPRPRLTWFKNGVRIIPSQKYQISYKTQIAMLRIKNVGPDDAGHYTLLAENSNGRVISSAQLIIEATTTIRHEITKDGVDGVFRPTPSPTYKLFSTSPAQPETIDVSPAKSLKPSFVKVPTDREVTEGKMVRFDCRVTGRPYPDVLWYLNGKLIVNDNTHKLVVNEAGNHSLLITLTNRNDAGTYTCIARNKGGEASFQVKLTVIEREQVMAPKFVERFQTMHVREGEPVSLHCRAVGSPVPTITWQKDGVQIHSSPGCRIDTEGGTSSLTFIRSLLSDSAWYQCTAQNSAGSTATRARLFVESEPTQQFEPWRLSLPRPTKVIRPEGSPEREIIWLRHVERARPHKHHEEEDTRLRTAPMFTHRLKNVTDITEGERVHFEARLVPIGDPTMKIEWFFNGRPLDAGSRFMTHYHFGYVTLTIISSSFEDAGTYTCHAVNELGEDTTEATLTVTARSRIDLTSQYPQSLDKIQVLEDYDRYHRQVSIEETVQKPVFIRELKSLTDLRENQFAHFEAQVTPMSDPTMKIEWYFNGRPLQASSRITTIYNFGYVALNISHIRPEDSGTYVCTARNKAGTATTKATLTVTIPFGGVISDTGVTEQKQYIEKTEELEAYQRTTYQKFMEEEFIETAPKFLTELRDQPNIPEGQTAHFEARLEPVGDPNLKVIWLKDGRPLEASSRITTFFNFGYVSLTIKDVKIHDIATYTCRATNRKGTATSTARLTILTSKGVVLDTEHPEGLEKIQHLEDTSRYTRRVLEETIIKQIPRFTTSLKGPGRLNEGQAAHFETRLEPQDDYTMKVEWFLNGRPIQTGHRFKTYFDFGYVALDILYVYPEDSGLYTVRATNDAGTATQTSELYIEIKKSIDTSVIHKVGMERIQRLEDSHFVEPTYDIEEISKSKPYFTVPLKDLPPLKEDEHVHLECRLEPTGDPTMRVEWFFNGRPLTVGTRFKTIFDFGYVALDITTAYPEDTGEYTVRATNHLGTAHTSACIRVLGKKSIDYQSQYPDSIEKIQALEDSSRYRRDVYEETEIYQMPTFVKPLHSLENVEGSNIHLECRLHPVNDPTMRVDWLFNGQPVKTGHRFRPAHDFDYVALDILSVYPEDSGIYTCRAINRVGEAVTSASVKIIAKKSLILESQHPEGLEQIQYLEDTSRYQRETWTEEVVRVPPRFLNKFKDLDLREGQNAHFESRLEPVTDPNLKVEWFRNEKSLTVGHRFRPLHDFGYVALDILGVVPEDTGVYKCRATNIVGSDELTVRLTCKGIREIITETQHEESLQQISYLEDTTRYQREEIMEEVSTQPPVFTTPIRDIEIKEGQRSHYECRLIPVSDPNMKVEWFRNNVPVKSGTRFTETNSFGFVALDILTTYPEDSGTYTCKATNPLGSATTSATLKCHAKRSILLETQHEEALEQIQYLEDPGRLAKPGYIEEFRTQAPVFTSPMKNLQLMENQSAHFESRLIPTADPNLRVEWFRNGLPIQAANRVTTLHDFGYVALDLSYVKAEDSGTYTCKASNDMGTAVTSATLAVTAKSSLIYETQHPEGLERIQQLEDSSRYYRAVEEDHRVTQRPTFVTQLTGPTQRMEGQSTHMECRIEPFPDPDLKVEWFFNGKPLQIGHRFRTLFDFGFAALDILTVYPEDSGEYMIRATNKVGTATSSLVLNVTGKSSLILETQHPEGLEQIHYLEDTSRYRRAVYEEPRIREKPQFVRSLHNLEHLKEGQSAHLECTLTPVNDPTMKVEWFFNGTPVPKGHRFKTTFDFGYVALDILYVYPEDVGTYMCKATNDVGEAITTCHIQVEAKKSIDSDTIHEEGLRQIQRLETVYERPREEAPVIGRKPEFLIPLVNQNLKEGQSLHLETRLEPINDPDMKVEWFSNGIEIQTGHRFRTTHDFGYVALDILYTYPEDVGTYMCRATNKLGEAIVTCSVQVQSKKSIYLETQHPEGLAQIRRLEDAPKFVPEGPRDPAPRPPVFTTQLTGQTHLIEGESAHVECRVEPVHDPYLTVEFFHNGTPLEAGSRFHVTFDFGYVALDISHVMSEDTGEYTAVAKNKVGQDVTSIVIEVSEKGAIITDSQHPEGLEKIHKLEDFDTRWARPPQPEKIRTVQPPIFTVPLQNIDNLVEGQEAHLHCKLIPVGDPTMKVEWFHNDRLIPQSSRYTMTHDFDFVALDMQYVRPEDAGIYRCRATNEIGEAVTTMSMKIRSKAPIVYDTKHPEGLQKIRALEDFREAPPPERPDAEFGKPIFTAALTGPTELWEGEPAHYECRVIPVGDPSLHFEWFINGIELRPSARQRTLNDFGMVTLDIGHVIPEDAGVYMCKAINNVGEAVTSTSLKVKSRRPVQDEPLSEAALQQIQRFEDDRSYIPEVMPEPKPQPPFYTTHLESHEQLVEGQAVHLQATVEPKADEKLRVEWFKNGLPLQFGTRMRDMFDFGLVTLDISGVRSDDSGIYTCRAFNEVGEAVTTCSLKVTDKPWLIGHPVHPESLDKIRRLEEPQYVAPPEELEAVFGPPVFLTHLNNVECWEGDASHFECRVGPYKDPTLKVEFFYNGEPLPLATKFTVTNDLGQIFLDISHSFPEDAGVYMCKATNAKGQAMTSGSLKVHSKRNIIYDIQHPKGQKGFETVQAVDDKFHPKAAGDEPDVLVRYPKPWWVVPLQPEFTINETEPLHLEGKVEPSADPKLTIDWFLNGKPLEMGSRFKFVQHDFGQVVLDLSDAWPRDSGIYTCRAKNDYGEAFTTTTVNVVGKGVLLEGTLHPKGEEGLQNIQDLEEALSYESPPLAEEEGQPPVFTSQFENLTNLTEGEIAHFEASLIPAGDQTMVVEWFFNGQPLPSGHRLRTVHAFGMVVLEILGVYLEDTGIYTCRATNRWGQAEISVNLDCIERMRGQPPVFTTHLQDLMNLKEGDSAHFECHLIPVGDPAMKVEWFHNGVPMRDSSRIKTLSDFGYVVMDISFTEPGDNGEYVCHAYNNYGEDFTRCKVFCLGRGTLFFDSLQPQSLDGIALLEGAKYSSDTYVECAPNQPPHYTTHIQSLEKLVEGHSAHFEATLIPVNDQELKVEWFFNGEKLQHGHRFRTFHDFGIVILDILYCYAEDSGVYEAVATNRFGQDITRATLKCRPKASLIFDPQIPKEMEGGLEKIQYLEDALYRSRQEMVLEPGKQPPVFTVPLENQSNLREGENAHLEARLIPVDDPKLKVEWFKNGMPLRIGSRLRAIHDFGFVVLEISPVYPEDSGEYHCRAKNELGEAVTSCTLQCEGKRGIILESQLPQGMETGVDKIAQLEGYSDQRIPEQWVDPEEANPPQFITQPEDQTLVENSLAHFECQLIPVGDPSMRVEWFHNGKPISAGSRVKAIHDFGYVILEIAGAFPRDSGLYTCKATNKHGEATTSCKLTVKSKLGIIMEPQLPGDYQSGTESLQRLEDKRYQKEEPMQEDEVPRPPIFITQIQNLPDLKEGDPAHFECRLEPVGDPTMRVEWFHNGKPLDIGTRVRTLDDFGFVVLDIDWTFPRDCGEYLCRATNKWGTDQTSAGLMCKGKRDIILDSQLPEGMDLEKLRALERPPDVQEAPSEEIQLMPPKFITQIQDVDDSQEGDLTHFDCKLIPVNDPKLKVQWYHDGEPLQSGHRFKSTHDFDYVALDILYSYAEDSGEYLAKAENDLGQDITKANLKCKSAQSVILYNQIPKDMKHGEMLVQMEAALRHCEQDVKLGEKDLYVPEKGEPPRFLTQIQNLDLRENDGAKFECQLAPVGDPNIKIEWFLNGRPLPYKSRFNPIFDFGYVAMEFDWVYPQDSGEYVCRATNQYGSDETRAFLKCSGGNIIDYGTQLPREWESALRKVQDLEAGRRRKRAREGEGRPKEPPTFLVKLEPFIVDEGEWAKFRVRVAGNPKPRLTWYINGKRVVTGSRYKLSYDGMHRLDIPKARQYDHGKIEVFAKNSVGEASCATTLDVRPKLDDYRALLKRSPRPWYDTKVKVYQEERKDLEVERKFEEHLDITKSNLYHVDEDTRKHLCTSLDKDESYLSDVWKKRRIDAQGIYVTHEEELTDEEREQRLKDSISLAQHMAKTYEDYVEESVAGEVPYVKKSKYRMRDRDSRAAAFPDPVETSVYGREILTQKQMQTQKEQKGDQEITRKKHVTEKVEQEHKGVTRERIVRGPPIEGVPPIFTKQIAPCRAYEGDPGKFECEFTGTPVPNITWYRENYPIKSSPEFLIMATDTTSTLIVKEVFMEDSGDFSVLAQNRVGTAKSNSNLLVEERKDRPQGAIPPSFLVTAQDVNVKAGQLIRLDTKVAGTKPLDIYWLKNGKKVQPDIRYKMLEEDDQYTLLIIEAFPEDIGTYECVALSKVGEARCQAQVYVEAQAPKTSGRTTPSGKERNRAPAIVMGLKDQSVKEGQPAIFKCRISGQPVPQAKWFRGDTLIKPSRYFRMTQEGEDQFTLHISEAFPEDEGVYKCTGQNPAGLVSTTAKLNVLAPESTGVQPTVAPFHDVRIREGNPAKFSTQISGSPAPTVQWYREGILIPQSNEFKMVQTGNSCSLIISTTYPEDTGRYTCRATNPSGQAEASAQLRVEKTGAGPFGRPNTKTQTPADKRAVSKQEITLRPAQPPSTVSAPKGKEQEKPPKFTQELSPVRVTEGQRAVFECQVEGQPIPQLTWYHNGREIKDGRRGYTMSTTRSGFGRFEILQVAAEGDDKVSCKAKNRLGEVTTNANLIIVVSKDVSPKFTRPLPRTVDATQGESVTFECTVTGTPTPTIRWFRGSREIRGPSKDLRVSYEEKTGAVRLVINAVFAEDQGPFRCLATNARGQDETKTQLIVHSDMVVVEKEDVQIPPKVLTHINKSTNVKEKENVEFQVTFEAMPPANVDWYCNGKMIRPSGKYKIKSSESVSTLSIVSVSTTDGGKYEARIRNQAGVTTSLGNLQVTANKKTEEDQPRQAPVFVKALVDQVIPQREAAILDVEVKAFPQPTFKWFRGGADLEKSPNANITVDGNRSTLVISEMLPADEGEYRCIAKNPAGAANTKAKLTLEKAVEEGAVPPKFTSKLKDLRVMDGEEVKFMCTVTGKPFPTVTWLKNGQPVKEHKDLKLTADPDDGKCQYYVSEAFPEDAGEYCCKAKNDVGETITKATLTVDAYEYIADNEIGSACASVTEGVSSEESAEESADEDIPKKKPESSEEEESGSEASDDEDAK